LDPDLDSSEELRKTVGSWCSMSATRLPSPLACVDNWLPKGARLTFCEYCWDEDTRSGRQPYLRRRWLKWTAVHCPKHQVFLCSKIPTANRPGSYGGWREVWASRSNWAAAFELPVSTFGSSLWCRANKRLTGAESAKRLTWLERFENCTDRRPASALSSVLRTWLGREQIAPMHLENRIEVLRQAAQRLGDSSSHQS